MKAKYIGIFMDHARAHLMEFGTGNMSTKIIESKFTYSEREETLLKGEKAMHHKEQHEELAYYKEIGAVIQDYDEVLLFGPTEAKTELYNILTADPHYKKIRFAIRKADKLTENQQHAFVKEFFTNLL